MLGIYFNDQHIIFSRRNKMTTNRTFYSAPQSG